MRALLTHLPLHTHLPLAVKPFHLAKVMMLLFCLSFVLSACGKRPDHIKAPPDVDSSAYYQVYPDHATDPKP